MPEKVNFNKSQKEKQIKILNYFKKNMQSQAISIKEVPKPTKKTKKHHRKIVSEKKLTKTQPTTQPTTQLDLQKKTDILQKDPNKQVVQMD